MNASYRFVKLLKNRLYPTYQLHAFMANDKTDPKDGLRLAALTTMHWLKSRLGNAAQGEWDRIPSPEEYLSATDEDLPSLYVNQGFVINIVSLPDKGMWSLQITEPDLGSDPGNPNQTRQPVPGRIIETNIAFQIVNKQLECGFKTVISDPVGTVPEAEVYRPTVVKLLMNNPAFGLKQVTDIPMSPIRLTNSAQVKKMLWVTHSAGNQLPAVVFTQLAEEKKAVPLAASPSLLMFGSAFPQSKPDLNDLLLRKSLQINLPNPVPAEKTEPAVSEPPYDLDRFCYYTFSHCRTYVLEAAANKAFTSQSGISFRPGDIILMYPTSLGGGETTFPYRASDDPAKTARSVEKTVKDVLKSRNVDFGHVMFLSGVREHLLHMTDELMENAEASDALFRTEIEQLTSFWKDEVAQKERELNAVAAQLQRQKEYASRLEDEKAKLREDFSLERASLQETIDVHLATIEFLKRRYDQPADYDGIDAWVRAHFSGRLILHPKAVSRMLTRSNQCAAVELVCDALDFLATDYWEMRYRQVPRDIILTRCAEKYGRPFEVKPTGQATIEFTPGDYRIRYGKNAQGKDTDRDLDYHLRVGNDPENLLRIYFLHDDSEKLIVVGSLPDHLRAVKVQ